MFSTGGGEEMARRESIKFLGSLPVDTELVTLLDAAESSPESDPRTPLGDNGDTSVPGFSLWQRYQQTPTAPLFAKMAEEIARQLSAESESSQ